MIPFPLTKLNRVLLGREFASVPKVDISVDCALEDQMGKAYVDQLEQPTVFLIEQGGFFCYLAGDAQSEAGSDMAQQLPSSRLLMSWSPGWQEVLQKVHGERLISIERYFFSSDNLSSEHVSKLLQDSPVKDQIKRLDIDAVKKTSEPMLSVGDFDSPDDFLQRGIGFGCVVNDKIVGAAYSSLVSSKSIEISIFVDEEHRRKGIATAVGAALLQWCLDHHVEPHWDAANDESCKLATKLGYAAQGAYKAYYLK